MDIKSKLASRKFWVSVAAFLASVGGTIAGVTTDNQTLMVAGVVCTALSAAIYAACEAYVDGQSVASSTTATTKTVSASTTSADVVKSLTKEA